MSRLIEILSRANATSVKESSNDLVSKVLDAQDKAQKAYDDLQDACAGLEEDMRDSGFGEEDLNDYLDYFTKIATELNKAIKVINSK